MFFPRCLVGVVFLALGAATPAQDARPVRLEWKFEKNKTFYQKMTTDTRTTGKARGQEINQRVKQTLISSWTPLEQKPDGSWVIKVKVEACQTEIEDQGKKTSWDSTKDDGVNPLSEFIKLQRDVELTLTVSPDLLITKVAGREELVGKLVEFNPQMKPLVEAFWGEDAIKQMADPIFGAVPNREVKRGDTWSRESTLSMGPFGSISNKYTFSDEGPGTAANVEKVLVKNALTYKPSAEIKLGDVLSVKVKAADLKTVEAGGVVEFRKDWGRVERSEMKLTITGKVTIEVGDETTDVDLTLRQSTTVTTSDENPVVPRK
jgi:hypothetical protein